VAMVTRYCDGAVPAAAEYLDADLAIQRTVATAAATADAAIERLAIHEAIAAIWTIVDELNGYITEQQPWVIAKAAADDPAAAARLGTVLYTATEGLRALAVLLSPVIPKATATLWDALGAPAGLGALTAQPLRAAGEWGQLPVGSTVSPLTGLFPRLEEPVPA